MEDWIPEAFPEWVATDGDDQRTLVATVDGQVCGICQGVLLGPEEAWVQYLRVHPEYRGHGVSRRMTDRLLAWCRNRGAVVARNMVFVWNGAGLGQSRAIGFEPATELRFASPEPTADADPTEYGPDDTEAVVDPAAAWRYWSQSDAREHLRGLAADDEERWALRELTRSDLQQSADGEIGGEPGGAIAIRSDEGTIAMAVRTRIDRRESDETDGAGEQRIAVYGATAWEDREACTALFSAIAADAAAIGAEETKVLLPETVEHVSDVAACHVEIGDEPDFVLAADLTGSE
jgi:predicted GNAT family acetyltransferase